MENLATHLRLPAWLDTLLFDRLGARYRRARTDMTVIDWDRDDVLSYLGTYFPRSYAEARCLFTAWFGSHAAAWRERTSLRVFDFGCGTGGEVFGLLDAVARCLPGVREVTVTAADGNHHALRLFERVGEAFAAHASLRFRLHPLAFTVDDAADLRVLGGNVAPTFDLVLSCKAVCELVSRGVFAPRIPTPVWPVSACPDWRRTG